MKRYLIFDDDDDANMNHRYQLRSYMEKQKQLHEKQQLSSNSSRVGSMMRFEERLQPMTVQGAREQKQGGDAVRGSVKC